MKKSALLYDPYLDVMGGGEKHVLAIMSILAEYGYRIDIAWDDPTILGSAHQLLQVDISAFQLVPNFFRHSTRGERLRETSKYDVLVYVTDGSYFMSKAQRNVIFAMYPQKDMYTLYPTNWLKLQNYEIIANGEFTAEKVGVWLHKKPYVIYPYVDQLFFSGKERKSQIILSVGRIFKHLHSKRQDVLIQAFKKLKSENSQFQDFKLIIAGGLKDEDAHYLHELQELAEARDDIEFQINLPYRELISLYHRAMLFWHAAGFGIHESKQPELVEHVGIAPLEAMAAGCVVVCYDAGGPRRYIHNGENGYTFTSIDDLIQKTARGYGECIKSEDLPERARQFVSTHFSYPIFRNKVEQFFRL